jgi:hypothetical protein
MGEGQTPELACLGKSQADRHAEVERRFLIEPHLAGEIVHQFFDELVFLFADDLLQPLDDFFLALHVDRREQLIVVQRVEQFVVLGRTLLFDVTEGG